MVVQNCFISTILFVSVGSMGGPDLRPERSQGCEGRVAKFVLKNHT